MGRPKGYPKTGGRRKGTPNKDKPYKAALQAVIGKHPELLEQIALAQLRAAAGLSEEKEFVNVAAAKEITDRLDGRVAIAAEVEAVIKLGKINNVIVDP
jgi:hypothetical protein